VKELEEITEKTGRKISELAREAAEKKIKSFPCQFPYYMILLMI